MLISPQDFHYDDSDVIMILSHAAIKTFEGGLYS